MGPFAVPFENVGGVKVPGVFFSIEPSGIEANRFIIFEAFFILHNCRLFRLGQLFPGPRIDQDRSPFRFVGQ